MISAKSQWTASTIAASVLTISLLTLIGQTALAQNLTTSSTFPDIRFDDTDDEDCTGAWDWRVAASGGVDDADTNNWFSINGVSEPGDIFDDCANDVSIITLNYAGGGVSDPLDLFTSSNSMVVEQIGDIRFAGNRFFMDRTSGHFGIGTDAPDVGLQITLPDTASLKITDISEVTKTREMFKLENNGPPRFVFEDTSNGETWNFQMTAGGALRMYHPGGGDGQLKMWSTGRMVVSNDTSATLLALSQNGDLTLAGDLTLGGTLNSLSDKNSKQDFETLSTDQVLTKIGDLPMTEWSYKDRPEERHVGPMAQDFHAAFGLGKDDRHIAVTDMAGVALAGVQALRTENAELRSDNDELRGEIAELRAIVEDLAGR